MDSAAVAGEHLGSVVMARSSAVQRSPEAIVRREASRRVGRRIWFIGHAVVWTMVGLLLLVTAGFLVALIVMLAWGVFLASHGFFAVVAPELRNRWTEREVALRLKSSVADERRQLEGRHSRSLEELSASIAHEIRNPITAAKSLVQQINEDPAAPENREYAKVALEELARVERSVSHLLRYAREEEMRLADVDLTDVVRSALQGIDERISKSKARVERDLDFDARLRGDPEKLRAVVMNLVTNSLDAVEETEKPDPLVRISSGRSLSGTEVWLRVKDNGAGIEPARLAKIWSPFHTSKKHGTGLGLAIAKKLVDAHGGSLEVSSELGAGTEFVATFPAQQSAAQA